MCKVWPYLRTSWSEKAGDETRKLIDPQLLVESILLFGKELSDCRLHANDKIAKSGRILNELNNGHQHKGWDEEGKCCLKKEKSSLSLHFSTKAVFHDRGWLRRRTFLTRNTDEAA